MESNYKHVTYGVAKFYIEDGMYSIKELEDIVEAAKDLKRSQDEALTKSMMEVNHV